MGHKSIISPIKMYAKEYARIVCNDFFEEKGAISGKEIMHLTDIKQVNLFVVQTVFQKWQQEIIRLKSPYFSYIQPDVKAALENLMNLLSKNINIERSFFEPILEQAVTDTLVLTFSPSEYLYQILKSLGKRINPQKELTPYLKYIRLHNEVVAGAINKAVALGSDVKRKEAIQVISDYCYQQTENLEDPFETVYEFDQLLALNVSEIAPNWKAKQEADILETETEELEISMEEFDIDLLESQQFNDDELEIINPKAKADKLEGQLMGLFDDDDDEKQEAKTLASPKENSPKKENIELEVVAELIEEIELLDETEALEEKQEVPSSKATQETKTIEKQEVTTSKEQTLVPPTKEPISELESLLFDDDDDDDIEEHSIVSDTLSDNIDELINEEKKANEPHEIVAEEIMEEIPLPNVQQASLPNEEGISEVIEAEIVEEEPQIIADTTETVSKMETVEDPMKAEIIHKVTSAKRTKSLQKIIPPDMVHPFTEALFGGKLTAYNEAIAAVDSASDYHDAVMKLRRKYVIEYDWDLTQDITIDFLSMVDKSF